MQVRKDSFENYISDVVMFFDAMKSSMDRIIYPLSSKSEYEWILEKAKEYLNNEASSKITSVSLWGESMVEVGFDLYKGNIVHLVAVPFYEDDKDCTCLSYPNISGKIWSN